MVFKPPSFDRNVRLRVRCDVFERETSDRPKWLASVENLAASDPERTAGLNHDEEPLRALSNLAKFRVPSWNPADSELTKLSEFGLLLRGRPTLEVSLERADADWCAIVRDTASSSDGCVFGTGTDERPVKALLAALAEATVSCTELYAAAKTCPTNRPMCRDDKRTALEEKGKE